MLLSVSRQASILSKRLHSLNELQKKRLYDYYFKGLTYRQIAVKEHVGYKNIRESVEGEIKKIKKICKIPPQNASPTAS